MLHWSYSQRLAANWKREYARMLYSCVCVPPLALVLDIRLMAIVPMYRKARDGSSKADVLSHNQREGHLHRVTHSDH